MRVGAGGSRLVSEYRHLARMLLRSTGVLERAEAALRSTVTLAPNNAAAWCRLGDVQRGQGKLADALECYRRAAALRPDDREASWLVAILSGEQLPDRGAAAAANAGAAVPFVRQADFLPRERCRQLLSLALTSRERFAPAIVNVLRAPESRAGREAEKRPDVANGAHPPTARNRGRGWVDPSRRNALIVDARITEREIRPWFEPLLRSALAEALPRLGLRQSRQRRVEMAMSAYLGGSFFAKHKDNGASARHTRLLSFAYYFHREPRCFSGGELLLHDASGAAFTRIEPQYNSMVFFPAACVHQVTAVDSDGAFPSPREDFAEARFVIHGGLRGDDA